MQKENTSLQSTGTSRIKASIVSATSRVMDSDFHRTPISFPGRAEQDPQDWWDSVLVAAEARGESPSNRTSCSVRVEHLFNN